MERRRAAAAETRAWEMRERFAETEARLRVAEDQAAAQSEFLRAQAGEQAQAAAEALLKRTDETFRNRELMAQQRLEAQLKPVADTLAQFQLHVAALEKTRADETGGLKEQLAHLMTASAATRDEARKLTEALRGNTGRRGRWGEQTCRNVLEAAGMAGRFDFVEQTSAADDAGRQQRPDFLVRMAGGGRFVIDAKVPLAFADEGEGDDEARVRAAAIRTAASMKTHMRQLATKAYQDQFKPSPDFVALFVPSDAFLSAALDHEPDLLSDAMANRVVIVTPSTLFALCKAVAYGWRAEEQAKNAEEVAKLGRELYKRLSVMGGHAAAVGRALDTAVGKYNQFVGSLESQVMVSARRFEDLHVDHEGKELPELAPVEPTPRALSRPELLAPPADAAE
ncbi:MAG: DNA recombination protein RmuC [Alphaproteobacteria bacterium]|nr:DNA recombination protein RmuC [Alphaproteobacteria bacterium]MBU1527151.1 DNA recombination protein RmuC [Alphaproteobacteria bacterium]MBU2117212.1 DNA recombination protein RmuC [Alphaproteobacteria bacterium]MBU2350653.1 DNA recombination protein RmuC [Alphaproteobacteria bacterium]MBU2383270.1 DNA recombination protein RmuC [Alphaproteobacteria bacterium]